MRTRRPICLLTDFGLSGPYVGLMHAAIHKHSADLQVLDIQHDLPTFSPVQAGLLLRALLPWLPEKAVVLAIVDPGVGSKRAGLIVECCGYTLVGPDNGLFAPMLAEASSVASIVWQPRDLSASFHGRDWFAPVGARLAMGESVALNRVDPLDCVAPPCDPRQVIYVDRFGNLITGLEGSYFAPDVGLQVCGQDLPRVRTFSDVSPGSALCYENSLGLLEIAVNQGSAAEYFGLGVGDQVSLTPAKA